MIALQSELVHSGAKLKTPGEEDWGMLVVKRGRGRPARRETELRGMSGGDGGRERKRFLMIEEQEEEAEREKRGGMGC